MTRPIKPRRIRSEPRARHFKPQGVPLRDLAEVALGHDELEAMRLADLEGLSHEDVGERMEISRATAGRLLASARAKVARALVEGLALRVEVAADWREGGYMGAGPHTRRRRGMPGFDKTGPQGEGPRTGRGRGRCGPEDEQQTPTDAGRPGRGGGGAGRGAGAGRGRGRGRGAGRGLRRGRGAPDDDA